MPQNVARHSLNVFQDYVAEYGFPDVMSTALVLVLLMERTVKERALRSVIVRRPLIPVSYTHLVLLRLLVFRKRRRYRAGAGAGGRRGSYHGRRRR